MRQRDRWISVSALTIALMMVWASSLWANSHYDYSQADNFNNASGKVSRLWNDGRYQEAAKAAEDRLRIAESIFANELDSPFVVDSVHSLAIIYMKVGRYDEAEPLLKRGLRMREKFQGNILLVAQSLNSLAVLYQHRGQYAKAESFYKRALAINEKALEPNHPHVAQSLNNLAVLYDEQGQYAKAEPLNKRALAIREETLGSDHPDVAQSLNSLAVLYQHRGQYAKAEPLFKRAIAIKEKALGSYHTDVAPFLFNLAALYEKMGRDGEEKKLLARAKGSALMEKDGVRFKLRMTSGVENDRPIDLRTTFSVKDNDKMYVFVHWMKMRMDMWGDHRVTVKWIRPDQGVFAVDDYSYNFKDEELLTWFWQEISKGIQKGVWAYEFYFDGKHLVTNKFTVTD